MGQTSTKDNLDETTLEHLIEMIDENNCLAKNFRRARDHYESGGQEFTIRLLQDKGKGKEYDLPSTSEQLRDDHPLFMSLQYPLLFPYGEYAGRLLHQYVVDVYTAIEEDRLSKGGTDAKIIGQRFILPPSFTGGPRYLRIWEFKFVYHNDGQS
ncbi:unnamed protein product [Brassica rapa subsp. trilocularis]|uniref:(rape) hypothetical protein n=1 Tax=Brassica napus TaxID=3708 RepID=A0A078GJT4_BRANA|nr:unnamed protein product [Brassica napus]CDY24868.1 BnaA03g59720D [Brassica napus]